MLTCLSLVLILCWDRGSGGEFLDELYETAVLVITLTHSTPSVGYCKDFCQAQSKKEIKRCICSLPSPFSDLSLGITGSVSGKLPTGCL